MTAPAAKKAATKVAEKKYAKTRPGPNSAVPKKSPAKKPQAKVVRKSGEVHRAVSGRATSKDSKFAQTYAPQQRPLKIVVTSRHILVAEFYVGLIIVLTQDSDFSTNPEHSFNVLTQAAAFVAVWVVLFGITSLGQSAAKFSTALGGLIVLTLLIKQGNIFTRFAGLVGGQKAQAQANANTGGSGTNTDNSITWGEAATGVAQGVINAIDNSGNSANGN